jgi:Spy/CpxP family protein refolding chaperone
MNRALQWKLIAGFLLVFIAGGMSGAFLAVYYSHHVFAQMHEPGLVASRMKERLRSQLNLTPEQAAKIAPIVDRMATELETVRMDTGRRVHQALMQGHHELAAILTDEQRRKFEQMESRRRRWHRFDGGPHPEPPPDHSVPRGSE